MVNGDQLYKLIIFTVWAPGKSRKQQYAKSLVK